MFVCKSLSLANYLLLNNCTLLKIDKDKSNNSFLVFIFLKNKKLYKSLSMWNID